MSSRIQKLSTSSITMFSRRELLTRSLTFGSSLLTLSLLPTCGSGSRIKARLKFANNYVNQPNVQQRIERALQNFKGVEVTYITLQSDSALNTLIADLNNLDSNSDNYPDIMALDGNWPYVLADRGVLTPLNGSTLGADDWQQLQDWQQKDAFPATFEAGRYKYNLYSVPYGIAPYGFWYNKNLLADANVAPPITVEELEHAMSTIVEKRKNSNVYPIGISTANTEPTFTGLWPWIWTFGGDPMRYDTHGNVTNINWTDDGTLKAFNWLRMCAQKNWTPLDLSGRDARLLMTNNQLAFKLENPSMHSYIIDVRAQQGDSDMTGDSEKDTRRLNRDFGVTTVPIASSTNPSVTVADINTLAISSRASSRYLAWQLIYFLTHDPSNVLEYQSKDGIIPPYKSYDKSFYTDTISQMFINKIIPTMRYPPYGPLYTLAGNFVINALYEIMKYQEIDIGERLSQLNQTLQTLYGL